MTDKEKAAGGDRAALVNSLPKHNKNQKPQARCLAKLPNGNSREFRGQLAKALIALVKVGEKGVTALEVASWAYRLAGYVWLLRRHFGLEIITLQEPHPYGWHARYVLRSPVIILSEGTTGDGQES